MNKKTILMLLMPALMLTTFSCTDYQDDIDKQGEQLDSLQAYLQEPVQLLQSMVYVPDHADGCITVDGTSPTTIRYRVEPKKLVSTVAADISRLYLEGEEQATRSISQTLTITQATADEATGLLTLTATPSDNFAGDGHYAFALVFSDGRSSYSTTFTPVYVVTHPTAVSLTIVGLQDLTLPLSVGTTYQLEAVFTPVFTTETAVTWTSSDENVATIDENGVLTPLDNGTTTITVTAVDDPTLTYSITITVTGGNIPIIDDGTGQGEAESRRN